MLSLHFTNRHGGVGSAPYESFNLATHVGDSSATVAENRTQLAKRHAQPFFMDQNHGDLIYLVGAERGQKEPAVDALITQEVGVALVVLVADCIPLLLWDELHGSIAAVHVGRRGLVNGIASKTIEAMRVLGAKNISATLGPSICGRCYEVDQKLAGEVAKLFPLAQSMSWRGTPALDLPAALERELGRLQVQVSRSEICTNENKDYFSYRRDGITGRQAGVISL